MDIKFVNAYLREGANRINSVEKIRFVGDAERKSGVTKAKFELVGDKDKVFEISGHAGVFDIIEIIHENTKVMEVGKESEPQKVYATPPQKDNDINNDKTTETSKTSLRIKSKFINILVMVSVCFILLWGYIFYDVGWRFVTKRVIRARYHILIQDTYGIQVHGKNIKIVIDSSLEKEKVDRILALYEHWLNKLPKSHIAGINRIGIVDAWESRWFSSFSGVYYSKWTKKWSTGFDILMDIDEIKKKQANIETTACHVLFHELAHHVYRKVLTDVEIKRNRDLHNVSVKRSEDAKIPDTLVFHNKHCFASFYADTNESEDFAEVYRLSIIDAENMLSEREGVLAEKFVFVALLFDSFIEPDPGYFLAHIPDKDGRDAFRFSSFPQIKDLERALEEQRKKDPKRAEQILSILRSEKDNVTSFREDLESLSSFRSSHQNIKITATPMFIYTYHVPTILSAIEDALKVAGYGERERLHISLSYDLDTDKMEIRVGDKIISNLTPGTKMFSDKLTMAIMDIAGHKEGKKATSQDLDLGINIPHSSKLWNLQDHDSLAAKGITNNADGELEVRLSIDPETEDAKGEVFVDFFDLPDATPEEAALSTLDLRNTVITAWIYIPEEIINQGYGVQLFIKDFFPKKGKYVYGKGDAQYSGWNNISTSGWMKVEFPPVEGGVPKGGWSHENFDIRTSRLLGIKIAANSGTPPGKKDFHIRIKDVEVRSISTEEVPVEVFIPGLDLIGKFTEITPVVLDAETSRLSGIIRHIATGGEIDLSNIDQEIASTEEIEVYLRSIEELTGRLSASAGEKQLVQDVLKKFIEELPDKIIFINAGIRGFFGIGKSNFLVVDKKLLEDNPLSLFHEIMEYMKYSDPAIIGQMESTLDVSADNEYAGRVWLRNHEEKYRVLGKLDCFEANKAHYALALR
ncbi:MAG: hypothetical protein KKC50_08060 [Candidatus Omnitrophica bacterium]|nr:hypothetical protein [Candidatus Omnitrophota bacterium]